MRSILTIFILASHIFAASAQAAEFCPDAPKEVQDKVALSMAAFPRASEPGAKQIYFVGQWLKLMPNEKQQYGTVLNGNETDLAQGLSEMTEKLTDRLWQDREALIKWVGKQGLVGEIDVMEMTADHDFLFVKATPRGIARIMCAAHMEELPSYLKEPGY